MVLYLKWFYNSFDEIYLLEEKNYFGYHMNNVSFLTEKFFDTFKMNCNPHLQNKQVVLKFSLNSKQMLQNFLYLYKKKTQVIFFVFHFEQLSFLPYEYLLNVDFFVFTHHDY